MKNQILNEMNFALTIMEETGKVNLDFLQKIAKFQQHIDKVKTRWLEYSDTDGFYFYQAAHSIDLILSKIHDRFEKSKEMNDTPTVALDTLALLPQFDTILDLLRPHEISSTSIDQILDQTSILRNTAADKNLIESIQTDRESLDIDSLKSNFVPLMKSLSIPTDQSIDISNNLRS